MSFGVIRAAPRSLPKRSRDFGALYAPRRVELAPRRVGDMDRRERLARHVLAGAIFVLVERQVLDQREGALQGDVFISADPKVNALLSGPTNADRGQMVRHVC